MRRSISAFLIAAAAVCFPEGIQAQESDGPTEVMVAVTSGVFTFMRDNSDDLPFVSAGASWRISDVTLLGFEFSGVRQRLDQTLVVGSPGGSSSYDWSAMAAFGATFTSMEGAVRPLARLLVPVGRGTGRIIGVGADLRVAPRAAIRVEGRAFQGLLSSPFDDRTAFALNAGFVWLAGGSRD